MQNLNLKCLAAVTLSLAFSVFAPAALGQTIYTFTKIADTNFFSNITFPAPSLNDAGKVAFKASSRDQRSGIFAGDGEETGLSDYAAIAIAQPGADVYGPGSYVGSRLGFAKILNPQTGTGGFFSSDGVSLQTIVIDSTIQNPAMSEVLMNRAGQVAYVGAAGDRGIYVAQNGSSNPVYTTPAIFTRGKVEMENFFGGPQINDAGAILFDATFSNHSLNPAELIDFSGLVQGNLNGSLPTLLVTDDQLPSGDFQSVEEFAGNNSGQVACIVEILDDVGSYFLLLRVTGGTATILTDTRSGPFMSDIGESCLAINDEGTILFSAGFKDANGVTQTGLFTGPDPINDKVIATGDSVFGSAVVQLGCARVGFNNQGQVAFVAQFNWGNAIVRADPSAGGSVVEWVASGDGSFDAATNWRPVNGDPPRVPEKTDTVSDTALFASCENIIVNLGTETADRLVLSCGNVTFHGGDFTAASLDDTPPSVEIDDARLSLDNSILKSSHAWIGTVRSSEVSLIAAQWTNQGRIEISKGGDGALSIATGSLVHSAEARIGNGTGHGRAVVNGTGSIWTTGNIAIGSGGTGELTIENGGQVNSDAAFVGQQPGLGNKVTVRGHPLAGPSVWHVASLGVGGAGTGQLDVSDGAQVDTVTLKVAQQPGVTGSVNVNGVSADSESSEILAGYLIVGQAGVGSLTIESGGLVGAGQADIGFTNGIGTVTVNGSNAAGDVRSTLRLDSSSVFSVGGHSAGSLLVENGGLVEEPDLTVVFSELNSTPSEIRIVGTVSELSTGFLKVGGNGNKGAFVTLLGGVVTAPNGVIVGANGVVRGFGTLAVDSANRFTNANGTISPGLSPGTITIDGSYEQQPGGRLLIEMAGTNSADYDHLIITNTATLDGTLELRFINGFAPKQGDTFNFLQVGGSLSNGFAIAEIKNLAPGFQFNVTTNGTNISLLALNDGVFVTPLQGQISSSNVVTVGGLSYLPYTLNITNGCTIVEPTGAVTQQGQEVFQTLSERADPGCQGASANVSRILTLGALAPGSYQFHFMSDGVVVYSVSFDVSQNTGQVLSFTRTAGGELDLQINGLAGIRYTMQASADLKEWFDLSAHVGDFLGPYHVFEPASTGAATRFYRVKIEDGSVRMGRGHLATEVTTECPVAPLATNITRLLPPNSPYAWFFPSTRKHLDCSAKRRSTTGPARV